MVTEIIRYRIPTGDASRFVDAWRSAGDILQRSENCHGFELIQSAKDRELFQMRIEWDSAQGHLEGFRRSALFGEFFTHVKPFVNAILEMEHYERIGETWRR